MPRLPKAVQKQETKTLLWFEQEILAHTPQVGILDGASLGYLSVAEHVGRLAGAWRNHRILMHDLDTELVTASLGELLGAVAQMAQAIGVSLETVAEGQVQRMRATPVRGKPHKTPSAAAREHDSTGGDLGANGTRSRRSRKQPQLPSTPELPPPPASRRGQRPTETRVDADLTTASRTQQPAPAPAPAPRSTRSPRSRSVGKPSETAPSMSAAPPSPPVRQRQRRSSTSSLVQPTLLEHEPATKQRKAPATAAAPRRRSANAS